MSDAEQLLTTAQAAERLGVNVRMISRLVERGELKPARTIDGGQRDRPYAFLFKTSDVEALGAELAGEAS